MKAIYRLGLLFLGCYFESAVRNASSLGLYWAGKQDVLQGLLPYLIPVLFGYVYAIDVRSHWSNSRLKNDIMAYVGSTLLVGYPLYIALSFWLAGSGLDQTANTIKFSATAMLTLNAVIAVLTWRGAAVKGHPTSMPWGDWHRGNSGEENEEIGEGEEEVTTDETAEVEEVTPGEEESGIPESPEEAGEPEGEKPEQSEEPEEY